MIKTLKINRKINNEGRGYLELRFLGATSEITGSRTLLTMDDGYKILIDFGMKQSNLGNLEEVLKWNGREFEFDVEEIDALILTHAHQDHVGNLPLLIKRGFKGKIITTAPTAEFCKISLPDSAKVMASDCNWANKRRPKNKLEPLYTIEEAESAIDLIQCYSYNKEIILNDNIKLELLCSGHMLGACMPKITYNNGDKAEVIIFTGDTSAKSSIHPFLRVADNIGEVDYIVCESTYGDRIHDKNNPIEILTRSVQETCIDREKTLLIPVFSMQRSSEILWLLRETYLKNQHFYKIPIYLDSPMAVKSQDVINNSREYWGEFWLERDKELGNIFDWEVIEYIREYKDSQGLKNGHPKVILSSSGMCSGGRVLQHLESFLPSKGCKILFVGYQAEGTLGRKILEGKQKSVAINRKQLIIRAEIEQMSFSSHADKNQIVEFLKTSDKNKLKKVFLNHGDENAINGLKKELDKHLFGVDVIIPEYNNNIKL